MLSALTPISLIKSLCEECQGHGTWAKRHYHHATFVTQAMQNELPLYFFFFIDHRMCWVWKGMCCAETKKRVIQSGTEYVVQNRGICFVTLWMYATHFVLFAHHISAVYHIVQVVVCVCVCGRGQNGHPELFSEGSLKAPHTCPKGTA